MRAEERRQAIREILHHSHQPVSATALAGRFSVSRQIIVGDIALLRAAGDAISATPRGYVILQEVSGHICRFACRHTAAGMEAELNAMVDEGCTVLDVIVEHPVYGQPPRRASVPGPLRPLRRPPPLRPDRRHPSPYPLLPRRGRSGAGPDGPAGPGCAGGSVTQG